MTPTAINEPVHPAPLKHINGSARQKLPPLPDFILEKLGGKDYVQVGHDVGFLGPRDWTLKKGIQHRIGDDGATSPSQSFMPQALKQEIVNGNYQALTDTRNQNLQDLQPNMTTIQNASDAGSAYATATNPSNGQKFQICASDSGWLWHYTVSINYSSSPTSDETVTECVVQSGSYSNNAKLLGLSYQTFTNVPTEITALAASAMAMLFTFSFVRQYILQGIYELALNAAVEAAAADAVAGGFMVNAAAASMAATILSGLAAGIVGVIVAIVVFFLSDFLHRSYGLTIAIYNWDTQAAWDISGWSGDNAVESQETQADGGWKQANLLPVQNSIPGPFGPITTDQAVAQYASYSYANDNEWLEGLGVAMSVISSNASFYFKYNVNRFSSNQIGYQSNTNGAIADFLSDSSSWRPTGDYAYNGSVDGRPDLSVTVITTSLNGDRGYSLDVHIGLAQST